MEAAQDFELHPTELHSASEGAWASCTTCHELIARSDWNSLEERAVKAMRPKYPSSPKSDIVIAVRHIQRQFRQHRQAS
jgi:hypothetical protein